mgnify:CR=1 FL=1
MLMTILTALEFASQGKCKGFGGQGGDMVTSRQIVRQKAIELLEKAPDGIRFSDLVRAIEAECPDIPRGTIAGSLQDWDKGEPEKVYKPARGLFRHTRFREEVAPAKEDVPPAGTQAPSEESFYEPFAEWLVRELEECTKAIPLGRNKFKDKWGTPDVIGIREPRKSDIIKPPTEIVSAEVKLDTANVITAFGQACSYKLFSHKSYLVIPSDSPEEDLARVDALCRIFGIGLILFDRRKPESPNFEIRVRAAKHEPDMFYANKYLRFVEEDLFR